MCLPTRVRVASFRLLLAGVLLLGGAALALPAHAQPAAADKPQRKADEAHQQAAAKKQLAELNDKMKALAQQQAATAARRDSANAELARRANALASAARAVRETDTAITQRQQQLQQLQTQRSDLQAHLDGQRAAIADLLRATYTLGRGSDLRLLLGDQDIAQVSRALVYSNYFQADRLERVQRLMTELSQLQQVETSITAEQEALQATRAEREKQAKALDAQRAEQQKLATQTNAQYKDEGTRLTALKQNADSLNQLLATLQKAIDEAAREAEREAARQAARDATAAKRQGNTRTPPPARTPDKALANIRGNLPWPASGAVTSYGAGVLIKASGGAEVHAVARGRVIYAAFLRGYGMLIILNHGDGWLSMYGNNETLLHGVGDQVDVGQPLGTASEPTGINTGVYFELRQHGKPVDPRSWLSQRR